MFKNNFINNISLPNNIEIGIKNDLKFNLVYIKGPFGEQFLKYPKTILLEKSIRNLYFHFFLIT